MMNIQESELLWGYVAYSKSRRIARNPNKLVKKLEKTTKFH